MEKLVFDFRDYRGYLLNRLGAAGQRTGLRAKACKALGCHSTYLSQVLTARTELSLEYGELLNRFFNHTPDEADFFLLLLQKERAGSAALRERFLKQIESIRASRATLKKQLSESNEISEADQEKFYSTWIHAALHVLVSLHSMKTKEDLARSLGISADRLSAALGFLEKVGLIKATNGKYEVGSRHIHLGADSNLIAKHHTNWRFHAIQSIAAAKPSDLHYSGAVSLSREAAQTIRENLLRSFQENMKLVRDAKEEVAYVYNFDFYQLDRHE